MRITLLEKITGSLIAAFLIASFPTFGEETTSENRVTEPTEFTTDYGRDNVYLKDRICTEPRRNYLDEDLNHFCKGYK